MRTPGDDSSAACSPLDEGMLRAAAELSRRCPPSAAAYSVGAILADARGAVIATGFSRELGPTWHAEEVALHKARLAGALRRGLVMYSTLEPCSVRASKPRSCVQLILEAEIAKVVYVLAEPPHFVDCHGHELLQAAGVEVLRCAALADAVREINAHLLVSAPERDQPAPPSP